jgi:phosphoribosylanthranilate isomerase
MTRVKICGITHADDMRVALDAGADYVGIVREPSSPRYVENPTELASIAAGRAAVIAVYGPFLDNGFMQVFDSIQTFSDVELSNALRVLRVGCTPVDNPVEGIDGPILLDAYSETSFGGSGIVADWTRAAAIVREHPWPVFLAGGLTPDNVIEAIRTVRPYAVDVSSGVESAPGRKDPSKVVAFIEAVRSVQD